MKLSKLRARTSMRSVGGQSIPRQNTTSFGMRNAMKASGGSCGDVEGGASRPRLDRPSRIKRADGGLVVSEKNKEDAAKLRKEAISERNGALMNAGIGAALLGTKGMGPIGKTLNRGIVGINALAAGHGVKDMYDKNKEADRAERGLADEGKEDRRKSGGRVHSDAAQDKKMIAKMIHKHEAHDHKGEPETKFAKGGSLEGLKDMKKGALRKSLHVKEGENIPEKKLEKAEHSDNPTLRKRAVLARTMRGWKKGG